MDVAAQCCMRVCVCNALCMHVCVHVRVHICVRAWAVRVHESGHPLCSMFGLLVYAYNHAQWPGRAMPYDCWPCQARLYQAGRHPGVTTCIQNTHIRTHIHAHTSAHTNTQLKSHRIRHTSIWGGIHTCSHTHAYAYIHMNTHCMCRCTYIQPHIHPCKHKQ